MTAAEHAHIFFLDVNGRLKAKVCNALEKDALLTALTHICTKVEPCNMSATKVKPMKISNELNENVLQKRHAKELQLYRTLFFMH